MTQEINHRDVETKWQEKWKKNHVFQPTIDTSKEKFFGTVPYPYANSIMHIGHGRTFTTADIYIRFQRVLGKNVLYPMGFHISGTPVLAVADQIAKKDTKQIKLTREAIAEYITDTHEQDKLLDSFKDPMNIATFFSSKIEETFDSVGLSIDWSRQFTTGDETYQKFIEWQFKQLYEKQILVQGKYPILYSPADKNAVGEDDIKDGDTDKVAIQEMTYLLFKLKNDDSYFAVATLRPDALFGTTNLWVDNTQTLVKVNVNGQTWIVVKNALDKLTHQYDEVKVLSEHKGEEFVGTTVITPLIEREVIVAQASFLDPNHGTGMAYSSPAGSPHDFMGLLEAKRDKRLPEDLQVINTVTTKDKKGTIITYTGSCPAEHVCNKYNIKESTDDKLELAKQELYKEEHYGGVLNERCGEFNGTPIKIAKDKVKEKLVECKLGGTFYETSRRAVTRSNDNVIVAVLEGQWFLDYSKETTKKQAYDLFDSMTYNPQRLRDSQKGYLSWVQLRPCARRRGLGTPLPFDKEWVIESLSDSTIYQMFYLISGIVNKEQIQASQLNNEFFDYTLLGKGNPVLVSEECNISKELLDSIRQEVEYWKAFDFRYTAPAHMSNHLSFLIYHYALIFDKAYWPKNITVGGLLIKEGEKMSKSKGNIIPLGQMSKTFGSDLYRLYIAVGANYDIEMDFRQDEITQLEKKFNRFNDLINQCISKEKKLYDSFSQTNKWLISKFYSRVQDYFAHMDNLRMREAYVAILFEFLNDIAYHERRTTLDETLTVLRFVVEDYLTLMTPAIPHACEEYNEQLGNTNYISLKAYTTEGSKYINKEIEELEGMLQNIISRISSKDVKGTSITLVQASLERFKLFDELKVILSQTKEFKTILGTLMQKFPAEKQFITKFVPKTLGEGITAYLDRDGERQLIESIVPYLEEEFGCTVKLAVMEDIDKQINPVPGNPSIILN